MKWLAAIAACASLAVTPAGAQGRGGMGMGGMGMGMMVGAGRDSATRAQIQVFHELVMNHDRITRTVTNLPDGIRTTTESEDLRLTQLLQDHVATMDGRVVKGDDPMLPMESPALHDIFTNNAKVKTTIEKTPKGVTIVQTSDDPATVKALQQHAKDVSDLVDRGPAAMHDAMMKYAPPARKP